MARGTAIAPRSRASRNVYLGLISAMAADKQKTHAQISNAELGSSCQLGSRPRVSSIGFWLINYLPHHSTIHVTNVTEVARLKGQGDGSQAGSGGRWYRRGGTW